eukprot:1159504-Pelagomonas_calceolata.AAC.13
MHMHVWWAHRRVIMLISTCNALAKVIRQQLHVGYDLLLIMGKEQQRQQLQATPERACVIWDEHASGAQLQSLAMLPALLTTPCLYAPLKVGTGMNFLLPSTPHHALPATRPQSMH